MVGGWAVASPDYMQWKFMMNVGYIISLIGIIIMIPALILKKKDSEKS